MPTAPDPTGLVFRSDEPGPGLHALIIGVSDYPNLIGGATERPESRGLRQLDSAARTAFDIVAWLRRDGTKLGHPLRTCRLLASPSEAELQTAPELAGALPATFDNLLTSALAWRGDAATGRDGAALFYFAGHGIQRTRGDSLLLLSDFLDPGPTLGHAVDLSSIYDGMGEPDLKDMAQTQYYFVDACRTDLPDVQKLADRSAPALWDVTMGGGDDRIAPIFYAAASGQPAYGSAIPGGVSAFGSDVLACFEGDAAELIRDSGGHARWVVTIGSLARSLRQLIGRANPDLGRKLRSFMLDKWTEMDATIAILPTAPLVECVLELAPGDAASRASVDLAQGSNGRKYSFAAPLANPHAFQAEAGGYMLRAAMPAGADPAYPAIEEIIMVLPPRFVCPVRFRP